jgi:hypothetical protein
VCEYICVMTSMAVMSYGIYKLGKLANEAYNPLDKYN